MGRAQAGGLIFRARAAKLAAMPPTPTAVAEDAPPPVAARERLWSPRTLDAGIIFGYLLLALWIMRPLWQDPAHLNPASNVTDPAFFEWALGHAARVFTHGENPFISPTLNAPLGVSMIANTGLLGMTVPLVPVTLLFGPSVSLVLIITLGLSGTATAWYAVIRRYVVKSQLAAGLGGLFCGFAPGMVNHANAHPNIVAQFLIPVIVFQALALASPSSKPLWRRGVVLGLLVTGQAFLNEELLFLTALAMGIFIAGYALRRPAQVRQGIRPFLVGVGYAAATAGVLLAYPLWFQFFGPQHYRGLPEFVLGYGTDLASWAAFPKLSVMHGDGTLANQPEENSFLGWPLLLLLPVLVGWLRRRPAVPALSLVGVVFGVLSLGQTINYRNHPFIAHGPWGWLNKLPLFDTVVPTRLSLVVIPVVGLLLAMCADAAGALPRPARYAWVAALVVVLAPITPIQLPVSQRPAVPDFFTSGEWHRYVRPGEAVVNADSTVWNGGIDIMHWDTATGQGFRAVGGYFLGPDFSGRGTYGPQWQNTGVLLFNVAAGNGVPQIGDNEHNNLVQDVRYWDLGIIVLAPNAPHWQDLYTTLNQLVGPGQNVDDVWVWSVRDLR